MEVVEILLPVVLEALKAALANAIERGIEYVLIKAVDEFGNVVTQIVHHFDSDGDGTNDSEEIIYTLQQSIPRLYDGYCLVNKGNEVGLGQPALKLVDASELLPILGDTYSVISDGEGFRIDFDDDGFKDDIFYPAPFDFNGDGINDFYQIVDDDDNGLPDLPYGSPFYPVGSDEYDIIIYEQLGIEEYTIMNKPLSKYTVTEGLLLIGFIFASFAFLRKIFRRRKVV